MTERLPRIPPVYRIKDLEGVEIEGIFYNEELQKVINTPDNEDIENIQDFVKIKTSK